MRKLKGKETGMSKGTTTSEGAAPSEKFGENMVRESGEIKTSGAERGFHTTTVFKAKLVENLAPGKGLHTGGL